MLVPKLRFKREDGTEYPEWKKTTFEKYFRVLSGNAFKFNDYVPNGVPIINGEAIQHGYINGNNLNYLPDSFLDTYSDYALKEGDIVLGLNRPITNGMLKIALIPSQYNNSLLYQRAGKIVFENEINKYFSYVYLSNQILKFTLKEAVGSDQPFISTTKLCKWEIHIPDDCQEIEAIGDFFKALDEVITQSEAEVQNLEQQKKAAMQKIFSQKVRFKREDGSEYPEWGTKNISDICKPHARIGWQNLRTDEFLDEGDYYLVTGTDFLNGRVNFTTCHFIDRERFEQDKNIQIKNGDILITKDGTLGKIALVENMDKEGTLNAGVFVLQELDNNIYNLYLYQYLTAPYLLNFASDKATGGTIKHLNQGVLVQFPVPIPCLEEQQKIADFLSAYDEAISYAKQELEHWKQLKKGLLQQMFV